MSSRAHPDRAAFFRRNSARPTRPSMLLAVALALAGSGCNVTQGPDAGGTLSAVDPADRYAGLNAAQRVELAMQLLEQGHAGEARIQLSSVIEQDPETSTTARRLLVQLDEDPETLLGKDSFSYEVKPGESLSLLAHRYLGDEFLFYTLARYNNIPVPGRVPAGRTLRIPVRQVDAAATALPADNGNPVSTETTSAHAIKHAEPVLAPNSMTARIYLTRAEKLAQQGDVAASRERLQQARAFVKSDHALAQRIERMETDLDRQEADFLIHQAKAALATGDTERAVQFLSRSVTLDERRKDGHELLSETRAQLVDEYKQAALLHLQAGQECSAMELWDKILVVEPGNLDADTHRRRVQQTLDGRQQECVNV